MEKAAESNENGASLANYGTIYINIKTQVYVYGCFVDVQGSFAGISAENDEDGAALANYGTLYMYIYKYTFKCVCFVDA